MFLKQRIAQCMVMSGMMLGAMTCFPQTEAPVLPDRPQEVGPCNTRVRIILMNNRTRSEPLQSHARTSIEKYVTRL